MGILLELSKSSLFFGTSMLSVKAEPPNALKSISKIIWSSTFCERAHSFAAPISN